MNDPRLSLLGIVFLLVCLLVVAGACTQQAEPTPTAQPTDTPEATPTLEPTDRSAPPPTVQPTDTPTPAPTVRPTDTPEAVPTPPPADTPEASPATQPTTAPFECAGLFPTNTPDPSRPEGIRNFGSQVWPVCSFEEAECITGYPIYVPTNLPDGFNRAEQIIVSKMGSDHFESRWVEHGWYIPGDPGHGFRLSQHSSPFGIDGEPFTVNGRPGEREVSHPSNDLPPLLSFLWEEDGYWFSIYGFLSGPITEEFLLEVAASLESRGTDPTPQPTPVPPECMGLFPTNTPDPNRPEGIRNMGTQLWDVFTYQEAECITGYPIAVPANLPEGFVRGEKITAGRRGSDHFEDRWVGQSWYIPGDTSYGFTLEQHSSKFSLGNGEPAVINGFPGERELLPERPPDLPPLLSLLWEEDGYWYSIYGFLGGPITEEFLLEVAASLEFREDGSG